MMMIFLVCLHLISARLSNSSPTHKNISILIAIVFASVHACMYEWLG